MANSNKIGVAIITYNRKEYYRKVLNTIPKNRIDFLVVVNDGKASYVSDDDANVVIRNKRKLGVAKTKNIAIDVLLENNITHMFIIEDDILIKDKNVFQEYINAANTTGIHHLCFEKCADNSKYLLYDIEYPNGVKIGFYKNPQGAFMYINAALIKKFGKFDENYTNAFEHIDFYYNLSEKELVPPFWFFPDILNSEEYLQPIEGSDENSTITNKEKYKENWTAAATHFVSKWGKFTIDIPHPSNEDVEKRLIFLEKNYSKKKIYNEHHKLSIIVPYRDRKEALYRLIPYLEKYVSKQVENYEIIIVEQNNDKPFNKGLLNNVGFCFSAKDSDYVCFHDVDLLPEIADYSYPKFPVHMSAHCSQFQYVNIPDKIMGGVVLFQNEHFKKVNGYSNEFNGWGKEDDDLYVRCEKEGLPPYKHRFGRFYSIPHTHRLTIPEEKELHEKNGERFRAFESNALGDNYHKNDGLFNCLSLIDNNEPILKEITKNTRHYLVNF